MHTNSRTGPRLYQICQTVQQNKGATITQDSSDLPMEVAQNSIDLPVVAAKKTTVIYPWW